jgi:hypothetical protein
MEARRRSSSGPDPEKYAGFKGSWDKDANAFVFASMEERDRYQIATYGHVRNGWREDDEPTDERPLILHGACPCAGCREYSGDIWRDKTESMTYEDAIEAAPIQPDEYRLAYLAKISAKVEGKYQRAGKSMPHVRMSRQERERQLQKLRGQMPSSTEIL